MKVLHLSTFDIYGGAARTAFRLNQGLREMGVDSQMLVQKKTSDDPTVIGSPTVLRQGFDKIRPILDLAPLQFYRERDSTPFSSQWLPKRISSQVAQINPDIVNLHWICKGYLQIETIASFNKPVIWTLHDSWAFTGGCHIPYECSKYTESCGACPQLHSNRDGDLSKWIWQRKAKAWKNLNLTIVTPSNWLARCANSSSLFRNLRIEVIPNGLDTKRYKPIESALAREILNLPQDKQLILFGAMDATSDTNKGFHLLQPALQYLSQSGLQEKSEVVIFGASEPINPPNLGFKCHYLGRLQDDISLVLAYSAADVMVVPSIQENLPNTVIEALACGTPCVGFKIGGMADIIDHKKNGYLAKPFEIDNLADGIAWILEGQENSKALSAQAVIKVKQNFNLKTFSAGYSKLYEEILASQKQNR